MIFRQIFEPRDVDLDLYGRRPARGRGVDHRSGGPSHGHVPGAAGQLGLRLALALDTHTHADHITALGALHDRTGCQTVMGERTQAIGIDRRCVMGRSSTATDSA